MNERFTNIDEFLDNKRAKSVTPDFDLAHSFLDVAEASQVDKTKRRSCANAPTSEAQAPEPYLAASALHRVCEYFIAHAPDEKPLWVIAVMHGRRNPRVMAAILKGRE